MASANRRDAAAVRAKRMAAIATAIEKLVCAVERGSATAAIPTKVPSLAMSGNSKRQRRQGPT
eukprot:scaffold26835_cov31-Tisochrysis_lutea.AAC.3